MIIDQLQMITTLSTKLAINHNTPMIASELNANLKYMPQVYCYILRYSG